MIAPAKNSLKKAAAAVVLRRRMYIPMSGGDNSRDLARLNGGVAWITRPFVFFLVYITSLEAKQEFQSKKENGCCGGGGGNILRRSKFWAAGVGAVCDVSRREG